MHRKYALINAHQPSEQRRLKYWIMRHYCGLSSHDAAILKDWHEWSLRRYIIGLRLGDRESGAVALIEDCYERFKDY